ncbi:MAG: polyketide cyclase [Winogradskyella sp.]|uniref:SRPBCC family protein n=1 Tax=Winogradskyella sp. TaxID=1883156 RepID=UPI000F3CB54F|nr:SRPBCC family protein [Winogradskyella sp.]RNC87858.1 MAG: polyketide cyclase [Winogradskyella sp.]
MRLTIFILMTTIATALNAQNKVPTNKHFWLSMETSASPEAIWNIWTDVPNWKAWDTGLKNASIKDDFHLGAKGIIISLEGRKSKFKVVEYDEGQSYTYKTKLPLGSLYVKRYLSSKNGKTIFTHEVWFKGLTGGIFAKAFGDKFRNMLPDVLGKIKEIAESR